MYMSMEVFESVVANVIRQGVGTFKAYTAKDEKIRLY